MLKCVREKIDSKRRRKREKKSCDRSKDCCDTRRTFSSLNFFYCSKFPADSDRVIEQFCVFELAFHVEDVIERLVLDFKWEVDLGGASGVVGTDAVDGHVQDAILAEWRVGH